MVLINRVTAPQATEGACFDMQHFILCITAPASTISFCFPASKGNVTLVLPSHMPEGVGIHAQCPLVKALWDYRIMMGKTPGDLICALLLWRKKQPNVGGGGGREMCIRPLCGQWQSSGRGNTACSSPNSTVSPTLVTRTCQ
jgi:hypothetical protein